MASTTLATAFQSARLVYTDIPDTDEINDWFYAHFENDPVGRAHADSSLLRPQTRARSDEVLADIRKDLLGVLICLPACTAAAAPSDEPPEPASSAQGGTSTCTTTETSTSPPPPKPTPIGVLHLADESDGTTYRHHHRLSVLSISVLAAHRGAGYGPEAVNWALDWAFTRAGLHAVSLSCFEFNERGRHVYEKLGFVLEGRFRKCHWHERRWWDVLLYSMLEEEWVALRGRE